MKTKALTESLSTAVTLTLALTACVLTFVGSIAGAQSGSTQGDKVGADVRVKVEKGERVNAIVRSNGSWSKSLSNDVTSNGGTLGASFANYPNLRQVSLPSAAVQALAKRSDVAYVSLDREVKLLGHVSLTSGGDAARVMANYSPTYDGSGVGLVVMDSGIDPNHVAFTVESGSTSRIAVSRDFTGEGRTDDPYGHGTHVAALAAGNGQVSNGAYRGLAPNARIINLRVLNSRGTGTVSSLLSAIDWVRTNRTNYNVRVVNMSLGTAAVDSYLNDPLCIAVRGLVNSGVVVVAAAGNEGKDGSGNKIYGQIHAPGNDPSVITVGATNTFGTDSRHDDAITTYSSRGPTRSFWTDSYGVNHYDNLIKPDLAAPGNKLIEAQAANNYLVSQNSSLDANVSGSISRDQMFLSGTSMAAPVVAGGAALLLQANPSLTPNLVKTLLMYTAQPLAGFNNFEQGAGQLNLEGAMRLARLVRTDLSSSTPVGAPLLTTTTAPLAQTTIAGHTFNWGQGVIMDQTFVAGLSLITKYQRVYALGVLLADGTALNANGVLVADGTLLSDGVLLADNVITSNGITISEGAPFLSCGVLLSDGVLIADGTMLSDGVLLGDGALLSDGVLLGDVYAQSKFALYHGDDTAAMTGVADSTTTSSDTTTTSKKK